ncbi:MAG: hypothetical protein EXS18_04045 [Verrucomicrobiae bacterium]|nr:hypothetical protein [Verrucomicrobiae bacterium]
MKFWFKQSWLSAILVVSSAWAEADQPARPVSSTEKDNKETQSYYAIEKLVVEPGDFGIAVQKTIDGMVINVKSPVKVVANGKEQSSLAMSSEFRDKNQRFAVFGMHSWLSVTYKITEESNKLVTLWLMEFDSAAQAKQFGSAQIGVKSSGDEKQDTEFKGEVFYQFVHNTMLLKVTWADPKTTGVDKIVSAYKARLMAF